jgi:hypothetical protein
VDNTPEETNAILKQILDLQRQQHEDWKKEAQKAEEFRQNTRTLQKFAIKRQKIVYALLVIFLVYVLFNYFNKSALVQPFDVQPLNLPPQ